MPQPPDNTWHVGAACREVDTDIFFVESVRGHKRRSQEQQAKQVCRGCPVLTQCLRDGLAAQERYGIWGGLTTAERDRLSLSVSTGA